MAVRPALPFGHRELPHRFAIDRLRRGAVQRPGAGDERVHDHPAQGLSRRGEFVQTLDLRALEPV
jgi:hypothetical protein